MDITSSNVVDEAVQPINERLEVCPRRLMDTAVEQWRARHEDLSPSTDALLRKIRKSFVKYGDMIVLPSTAFPPGTWAITTGFDNESDTDNDPHIALGVKSAADLEYLYHLIMHHLKATHIATTRPIPLQAPTEDHDQQSWNRLRAPLNFTPLYGDFGPATCSAPPTNQDFSDAFWVTAKQNGIVQIWAPRWTMFSRGNISEKARLLTLPSVLQAVEEGKRDGRGCCAVDLFVGIGYFGFSYLKAGFTRVLGWDINPWSIEGAVRGAKANGWNVAKVKRVQDVAFDVLGPGVDGRLEDDPRFVVWEEDNVHAVFRLNQFRAVYGGVYGHQWLPPVRHVNCGLLPSSRQCWQTAVEVLSEEMGGWLHVHENFAVEEIVAKAEEVRREIQRLCEKVARGRHGSTGQEKIIVVEDINRLKSYAPGVMHVVIDLYIPGYVPD
ncbi:hypothetical protein LTR62_006018 [Meristemomyces frigidus]|uniref:tRNA wybutosine-synthesizing protein 2 n=1 Tax=Meristemomyces frigidus TaxID=1508187 RepID=A0AAN7TI09_9PEZI|nr:hypothetical protein LTR62_006018 [Meristemomyces frigidus]